MVYRYGTYTLVGLPFIPVAPEVHSSTYYYLHFGQFHLVQLHWQATRPPTTVGPPDRLLY